MSKKIRQQLESINVGMSEDIDFSELWTHTKLLDGIPPERITEALGSINPALLVIAKKIKDSIKNVDKHAFETGLTEVYDYVSMIIDEVIEPEMSVRSMVNIYIPKDTLPAPKPIEVVDNNNIELNGEKYGPFKHVFQGKSVDDVDDVYDVSYDANQILKGKQMIYAGYGYSGSGKTHTLLHGETGVLRRLIEKAGFDFKTLTFDFIEIYGEIDEKNKMVQETTYYGLDGEKISKTIHPERSEPVRFKNADALKKFVEKLNTEYRTDWKKYERGKPRVRHTPNNDQSSRAHLIINVINKPEASAGTRLFSILDMGGSEDVVAIEKMYYQTDKKKGYAEFTNDFDTAMENILKIANSQYSYLLVSSIIEDDSDSEKVKFSSDEIKLHPKLVDLKIFFDKDGKGNDEDTTLIHRNEWKEVLETYGAADDPRAADDPNMKFKQFFLDDQNTFSVLSKYNVLDTLFKQKLRKNKVYSPKRDVENKVYSPKRDVVMIAMLYEVIGKIRTVFNFDNVELPFDPLKTHKKSYFTDLNKKNVFDVGNFNPTQLDETFNIYDTYFEYYKSLHSEAEQVETILGMIAPEKEKEEIELYKEFIKHLDLFADGKTIIDKYKLFTESIIYTYHEPVKRQGNYINESISEFNKLSESVKEKKTSSSPSKILSTLYAALNINNSTVRDMKLVIFTCMKAGHKEESILRSLAFAHCINPLKSKEKGFYECENVTEVANVTEQVGSGIPDMKLSLEIVEMIKRLGIYNLVKIVRWKYYDQNRSKSSFETLLLIDRIATLVLSIGFFLLKEDLLAIGVVFDQMISSILSSESQDTKIALLPYYVPFL